MSERSEIDPDLASAVTRILIGFNSANVMEFSRIDRSLLATLLVDNASSDDTVEAAGHLGYRTLAMGYNAGYARAVNAGLKAVSSEFALIANPDLQMGARDIGELLAAARRYPDADIFVPRIFTPEGDEFFRCDTRFEKRSKSRIPPEGDACIRVISGAVLLVRREPFMRHGGFDENIFLFFEDDDLSLRWQAEGRPIVFVASARSQHLGAKSSNPGRATATLKSRSFGWSWAYVMRKHRAGSLAGPVTATAAKCAAHALTLNFEKARRDVQILRGLASAVAGRQAPFPD